MQEAAKRDESVHKGINFEAFLTMLRSDPHDSLDMVCLISAACCLVRKLSNSAFLLSDKVISDCHFALYRD